MTTPNPPISGQFISQLPVATSLTGSEAVPIVQGGTTKSVEASILAGLAAGTGGGTSSQHTFFSQMIDVKNFAPGGVMPAPGTDITTYVQAAINSVAGVAFNNGGGIIYVGQPPDPTQYYWYTLGALTWKPNYTNWQFWFSVDLYLNATLQLPRWGVIKGFPQTDYEEQFLVSNGVYLIDNNNLSVMVNLIGQSRMENVIVYHNNVGIQFKDTGSGLTGAISEIRNCSTKALTSSGVGLQLDTVFWFRAYNCEFKNDKGVANHCISIISTSTRDYVGLMNFEHIRLYGGNVYIAPTSQIAKSIVFEDLHSEALVSGMSLLELDSSNARIAGVTMVRPRIFDPGGGAAFWVKNSGTDTFSIHFKDRDSYWLEDVIDPASTEMIGFYDESSPQLFFTYNQRVSMTPTYTRNFELRTNRTLDTKLETAPLSPQWTIGTPLAVEQKSSNWQALSNGTVTANVRGPDGSSNAGILLQEPGDIYIQVYNTARTLNVGDWLVAGFWAKCGNVLANHLNQPGQSILRLDTWSGSATGASFNGAAPSSTGFPFHILGVTNGGTPYVDFYFDGRWHWFYQALKVTGVGTGTCTVKFQMGWVGNPNGFLDTYFFNPCMYHITASEMSTSKIVDADVMNWARSYRGGWSSNAAQGTVACLDHQTFQAGTLVSRGLVQHGTTTVANLPGAGTVGRVYSVTDAVTPVIGNTVVGSSSSQALVWDNGANWTVIGK